MNNNGLNCLCNKARNHILKNQHQQALKTINQAIELLPKEGNDTSEYLYTLKADTLYHLNDIDTALSYYEKAISCITKTFLAENQFKIGRIHYQKKEFDPAKKYFIESHQNNGERYFTSLEYLDFIEKDLLEIELNKK